MKLLIGQPGTPSRMRVHRRGQRVEVDDGHEPVTMTCRSSAMARTLVRKLEFHAGAAPQDGAGDILLRALHEIEWAENRRRGRRGRARC